MKKLLLVLTLLLIYTNNAYGGFLAGMLKTLTFYETRCVIANSISVQEVEPSNESITIKYAGLTIFYNNETYTQDEIRKTEKTYVYNDERFYGGGARTVIKATIVISNDLESMYIQRNVNGVVITKWYSSEKTAKRNNHKRSGGYNGNYNHSTSKNYNNSSSGSKRSSGRTCPGCNGSGKGPDQITYSPNYTGGDNSRYCSTCGRTMSAHTHRRPMCRTCYGKGRIE